MKQSEVIFKKTGCVIMASGMGKRFGGNKLLADFGGKPMIQWILDATEGLFFRRVVVTRHQDVVNVCKEQGIGVVYHDFPGRNDTVRLGLEAIGLEAEFCVFSPSDQPLLKRETLIRLVRTAEEEKDKICRPVYQETAGAPVVFPSWTFSELLTLPEGKGGGVVIRKYPDKVRYMNVQAVEELKDIDTRQELEDLLRF